MITEHLILNILEILRPLALFALGSYSILAPRAGSSVLTDRRPCTTANAPGIQWLAPIVIPLTQMWRLTLIIESSPSVYLWQTEAPGRWERGVRELGC